MYSSTLTLTSALDGVGGQRHASATLPPGKTRYTYYKRLRGPQGRSGRERKILPNWNRSPDCPACSESPYPLRYAVFLKFFRDLNSLDHKRDQWTFPELLKSKHSYLPCIQLSTVTQTKRVTIHQYLQVYTGCLPWLVD